MPALIAGDRVDHAALGIGHRDAARSGPVVAFNGAVADLVVVDCRQGCERNFVLGVGENVKNAPPAKTPGGAFFE